MYKIIIYKFQEHFIRFYMGWDLIHQFNNTELCACPKLGPGFPISYVEVLSMLSWDVVACFVDIGGIVDHHCLNLF